MSTAMVQRAVAAAMGPRGRKWTVMATQSMAAKRLVNQNYLTCFSVAVEAVAEKISPVFVRKGAAGVVSFFYLPST